MADATLVFLTISIFDRPGGIQRFNRRVAETLVRQQGALGLTPILLSLADNKDDPKVDSIRLMTCDSHRWQMAWRFLRLLFRHRPSVLLLGHINLLPMAILARIITPRARTLLFVHGIEVWDDTRFRRKRWYEPWLIRHSIDSVVSVSKHSARIMAERFGLKDQVFRFLPNAVDVDQENSPEPRHWQDISSAPRLISVARLEAGEREKGIDKILSALAELGPSFPELQYDIVGDGALRPELEQQAAELALGGRVVFHGRVSDSELEALYARASVFVLPSKKEGFGIVFLEAWKHGLPVICGNADASPEVVTDGHDGLVVNPNDPIAIAEAIKKILGDHELYALLSKQGFETLCRNYTQAAFAERLVLILRNR